MSALAKISAKTWAIITGAVTIMLGVLAFVVLPAPRRKSTGPTTAPERTHQPVNTAAQVALDGADERARHNLTQLRVIAEEAATGERPNIAALVEAGRK